MASTMNNQANLTTVEINVQELAMEIKKELEQSGLEIDVLQDIVVDAIKGLENMTDVERKIMAEQEREGNRTRELEGRETDMEKEVLENYIKDKNSFSWPCLKN